MRSDEVGAGNTPPGTAGLSTARPRTVLTIWALLALAVLFPVTQFLQASFPILTVVWIVVPLIAVWRSGNTFVCGFRRMPWRLLLQTTLINLAGLLAVMLAFEPWSHTYQKLIELVLSSQTPDTTFAWLVRFPKIPALGSMVVYSGLVTLFGEELFFRGWLLQLLQKKIGTTWPKYSWSANIIQSLLFVIPNLLVSFVLPPLQGVLYAAVYVWLAIGMIGGWAASRTGSIWPSLISATLCNLILVALIV